ncbi:hypothetical protein [Streptomyces bluensis]|uniref:hypothetical protein n=1 Tax=Streptomyces bluensis TaxID=33897 RepID=UPI0036CCE711
MGSLHGVACMGQATVFAQTAWARRGTPNSYGRFGEAVPKETSCDVPPRRPVGLNVWSPKARSVDL